MTKTARDKLVACGLLVVCTLAAFWPVHTLLFTVFDDPGYVTENSWVKAGLTWKSVRWASTAVVAANWHPLTLLSHMTDCQLFGLHPSGHHISSLAIHLVNVLLLFWLLQSATGYLWRSAFAAGLFAVHPLNVESVAWIAERKNVLSTLFFLLTIWAYMRYVRSPNWKRYLAMSVLFVLGLMAKPMLVTLPFLLLLLDYWPLGRLGAGAHASDLADVQGQSPSTHIEMAHQKRSLWYLVKEKIPLMILSALGCLATIYAQRAGGSIVPTTRFPVKDRIANALISYGAYLKETIWPSKLAAFYPVHPHPGWQVGLVLFALLAVTVAALVLARRCGFLIVGWFWYLGTLVPVIGLVQVGSQSRADRYAYVPLMGIFILVVWSVGEAAGRLKLQRASLVAGVCVITALSIVTWNQVRLWHDTETLFKSDEQRVGRNWMASLVLGDSYAYDGKIDQAIDQYSSIPETQRGYAVAQDTLGTLLEKNGRLSEAIEHYRNAFDKAPDSYDTQSALGAALAAAGRTDEALPIFYRALDSAGKDGARCGVVQQNLGMIFVQKGQRDQAIYRFKLAIESDPDSFDAYNRLGAVLVDAGRPNDALGYFSKALEINPDSATLYANLGNVFEGKGDSSEAIRYYSKALDLIAHDKLAGDSHGAKMLAASLNIRIGDLFLKNGDASNARERYLECLRLNPDDRVARQDLEKLSPPPGGESN